jgi:hypothetical protein
MRDYGSAWRRTGCFGVSTSLLVTSALPFFFSEPNMTAERPPYVSRPKGRSTCPPQAWIPLRQGSTQGPLQRAGRGKGSGCSLRFVFNLNDCRFPLIDDMNTCR